MRGRYEGLDIDSRPRFSNRPVIGKAKAKSKASSKASSKAPSEMIAKSSPSVAQLFKAAGVSLVESTAVPKDGSAADPSATASAQPPEGSDQAEEARLLKDCEKQRDEIEFQIRQAAGVLSRGFEDSKDQSGEQVGEAGRTRGVRFGIMEHFIDANREAIDAVTASSSALAGLCKSYGISLNDLADQLTASGERKKSFGRNLFFPIYGWGRPFLYEQLEHVSKLVVFR